ncbi:MAG: Hsp70 family protein [Planctomycetales bacterium]|nr:Hsp70 family protein [Planctomycetales bacterium]
MLPTHAVGIDLGTTYSCIAYLNEHGEPVSLSNAEGETSTPSVLLYDQGEIIVGTEALRNAIMNPTHVIQNAKRSMGDPNQKWVIEGRTFTPMDVSAGILRKLLDDAQRQIGPIDRAVITVPAQFSDLQRKNTQEAGRRAGLSRVDIINEPVAAALCYVLGAEGLWFSELANEQRILVYDLGGGTFDLSLVKYAQNEVRVMASSGDLYLGGIDWNECLLKAVAEQFSREFGEDPREDLESLQHLSWEVEQTKRSLTVRPKAALLCQHGGKRKTYQIEQQQFNKLTGHLVEKTEKLTRNLLKERGLGWQDIDVALTTGGSSRMPMIRDMLKKLSGRTINTSLSPDQSIAHGACYYAGMLLTNSEFIHSIQHTVIGQRLTKLKQKSATARGLGILVRNADMKSRSPYYMVPANTPIPASHTHNFGTVIPNQKRVQLHIVESGTEAHQEYVELGTCTIEGLPPNLPMDSLIAVTISYDESARVHVEAKDVASGKQATAEIIRKENLVTQPVDESDEEEVLLVPADEDVALVGGSSGPIPLSPRAVAARKTGTIATTKPPTALKDRPSQSSGPSSGVMPIIPQAPSIRPIPKPVPKPVPSPATVKAPSRSAAVVESSSVPVPLCNNCGEPLNPRGECNTCGASASRSPAKPVLKQPAKPMVPSKPAAASASPAVRSTMPAVRPMPSPGAAVRPSSTGPASSPQIKPAAKPIKPGSSAMLHPDDAEIMELPVKKSLPPKSPPQMKPASPSQPRKAGGKDAGEEEFWKLADKPK